MMMVPIFYDFLLFKNLRGAFQKFHLIRSRSRWRLKPFCIHSQNVMDCRRVAWLEKIFRHESDCKGNRKKIHEIEYENFFSQFSLIFHIFSLFSSTLHDWKCFDKKKHEIVTEVMKEIIQRRKFCCDCCYTKDFRITIITANNK